MALFRSARLDDDALTRATPAISDRQESGPFRFLGVPNWLIVLLLTLVAGGMRFTALDKPSVWGDEAATWRRVCGSFDELRQELSVVGFMPAHYVATWWVKEGLPLWGRFEAPSAETVANRLRSSEQFRRRGFAPRDAAAVEADRTRPEFIPSHRIVRGGIPLTPFALRFIPALCGTLLVPAVYFLATQLVQRRTALLAAVLTCFSAYQLGYARDAKMYAAFWLFATIHVACLLWWLSAYRVRQTQADAMSARQRELGLGVAGVLSSQHVGHIARAVIADAELRDPSTQRPASVVPSRLETLFRWSCWILAGLAMVAFHAIGLAVVGLEVLILLITVPQRLGGWTRNAVAVAAPLGYVVDRVRARSTDAMAREGRVPPVIATDRSDTPGGRLRRRLSGWHLPPIVGFALGVAAMVSLWALYKEFTRFYDRVLPDVQASEQIHIDTNDAGIGWVESHNRGRSAGWFFGYNASAYLLSWEWVMPRHAAQVDPQALRYLTWTTTTLMVAIGAGLLPWRAAIDRLRRRPAATNGPMPATAALLLILWLAVPSYALYVAGGAWRVRPSVASQPAAAIRDNQFEKVRAVPPVAGIASIAMPVAQRTVAEPDAVQGALAEAFRVGWVGEQSWRDVISGLPGRIAWRDLFAVTSAGIRYPTWRTAVTYGFCVGFVALSLIAYARRDRRMPLRIVQSIAVIGIVFVVLCLIYAAVPMQEKSVWMPRYIGFVWPAFAIVAAVLIRRLPFAVVRWAVVLVFVAANVTNAAMRAKFAEPPTAQQASDFLASRADPQGTGFFAAVLNKSAGPGTGSAFTLPFYYYVAVQSGTPVTPSRVNPLGAGSTNREQRLEARFPFDRLQRSLDRTAGLDRFTLWTEAGWRESMDGLTDRLATRLAPRWTIASAEPPVAVYEHWTWRRLYQMQRATWHRAEPSATQPARK